MRKTIMLFCFFIFGMLLVNAFNWENQFLSEGEPIFTAEPFHPLTCYKWNYSALYSYQIEDCVDNVYLSRYSTSNPFYYYIKSFNYFEGDYVLFFYSKTTSAYDGSFNLSIYNLENYSSLNLITFVWATPTYSYINFICGSVNQSYPMTYTNQFLYGQRYVVLLNTTNCSKYTSSPLIIQFIYKDAGSCATCELNVHIDNIKTFKINSTGGTNYIYFYNKTTYNLFSLNFSNNLFSVYNYLNLNSSYNYSNITLINFPNEFRLASSNASFRGSISPKSWESYKINSSSTTLGLNGYSLGYTFSNLTGSVEVVYKNFYYILDNMSVPAFATAGSKVNATNQNLTILIPSEIYNFTNIVYNKFINITNISETSLRGGFVINIYGSFSNSYELFPYLTNKSFTYTLNISTAQIDKTLNQMVIVNNTNYKGYNTFGTSTDGERHKSYISKDFFKIYIYSPTGVAITPKVSYFEGLNFALLDYYNTSYSYALTQPDYKSKIFDAYGNCYETSGIPTGYNTSLVYYLTATYCTGVYSSTQISLPVLPLFQKCYYNSSDNKYYINIKYLESKPFFIYYLNESNDTNSLLTTTTDELISNYSINSSINKLITSVNGTIVCYYSNSSIFNIPEFMFGDYKNFLAYPLFLGVYVLSIPFPYVSIILLVVNDAFKLFDEAVIFLMVIMAGIIGAILNTETKQSLRSMITYTMVVLGYIMLMIINFPEIETANAGFSYYYSYIANYVNKFYNSIEGITNLALTPDNASNWIRSATTLGSLLIELPSFVSTLIGVVLFQIHPALASIWLFLSKFFMILILTTIALKIFTIVMNQFDKEAV